VSLKTAGGVADRRRERVRGALRGRRPDALSPSLKPAPGLMRRGFFGTLAGEFFEAQ